MLWRVEILRSFINTIRTGYIIIKCIYESTVLIRAVQFLREPQSRGVPLKEHFYQAFRASISIGYTKTNFNTHLMKYNIVWIIDSRLGTLSIRGKAFMARISPVFQGRQDLSVNANLPSIRKPIRFSCFWILLSM